MDQANLTTSPEQPPLQKELPGIDATDVMTAPIEKTGSAPVAERLSTANNAVQAAGVAQLQNTQINITQDDDVQQAPKPAATSSLIADDVDVIEKAWVQMAKAIVERTRDDPRQQSSELSHVKRDYISKRFNKDIKPPND